ncbi:hypothetical protein HDV05_007918, partial [Chytridiales sp. JEL 0842]
MDMMSESESRTSEDMEEERFEPSENLDGLWDDLDLANPVPSSATSTLPSNDDNLQSSSTSRRFSPKDRAILVEEYNKGIRGGAKHDDVHKALANRLNCPAIQIKRWLYRMTYLHKLRSESMGEEMADVRILIINVIKLLTFENLQRANVSAQGHLTPEQTELLVQSYNAGVRGTREWNEKL